MLYKYVQSQFVDADFLLKKMDGLNSRLVLLIGGLNSETLLYFSYFSRSKVDLCGQVNCVASILSVTV